MKTIFIIVSLIMCFLVILSCIRGLGGPGIFNRVVGINVIGIKTIVILLLIGFIYQRQSLFIDISLTYAILNFIAVLSLAKYLERKGGS